MNKKKMNQRVSLMKRFLIKFQEFLHLMQMIKMGRVMSLMKKLRLVSHLMRKKKIMKTKTKKLNQNLTQMKRFQKSKLARKK